MMSALGFATIIHLFGTPHVSCRVQQLPVPEGGQKLLAFVALSAGRVERSYAAGALWPFGDDARAAGNLRSALWRLRRAGIDVIEADRRSLWLAADVEVDVHQLSAWANRLIHGCAEPTDLILSRVPEDACRLLPAWYDEWAVLERERIRQRVLHALEAMSAELSALGRHPEAVAAAKRAVLEQPLRESGQRALLTAHLAHGDVHEARRAYQRFTHLLRQRLHVEPSRQFSALLMAGQVAGHAVDGTERFGSDRW